MKLRETRVGKYDMRKIFKGQKKGVKYEIIEQLSGTYYVMAHDIKKGLTLNSLWLGLQFQTVELAQEWCESCPNIEELRNIYLNNK